MELKRSGLLTIAAAVVVLLQPAFAADELWQNFDDGDLSMWSPVAGTWIANNQAYEQTRNEGPHYNWTLLNYPMNDGIFEFDVTVLEKNEHTSPFGSFGVMWKYIDGNNYCRARFGAYRMADIVERVGGVSQEVKLGAFQPVLGRTYHVKIILEGATGTVSIVIDGVVRAVVHDLLPGQAGRCGLFTESHTVFDNVHVIRNN